MYLGVKAVLAKSFERIHAANLVNFGILPLTFRDAGDYEKIAAGDRLRFENLGSELRAGKPLPVINETKGYALEATHDLSERQIAIVKAGGLLNYQRSQS